MADMKEIFHENNHAQTQLQRSITEVLKKFGNSSGKGAISENILYNMLVPQYPSAQIEYVGDQKESGDILFMQTNRPKILLENKDHTTCNVPRADVEKFIRDCEINQCCGIMFAQHRGITNKQNYELQIHNGQVLLYLHEVEFDMHKISLAIDIVENFKIKLDEIGTMKQGHLIDNRVLEEIHRDFQNFVAQKQALLKLNKDMTDKMTEKINDLKMPNLDQYLSSRFAFSSKQQNMNCKYCQTYVPKSMSQHYRYCSMKPADDVTEDEPPPVVEEVVRPSPIKKERKKNGSTTQT